MLSYRHGFHAGNFADVLKHLVLVQIIEYLKTKPSAIRYIDTHAGAGVYKLGGEMSQKTGEFRYGAGALDLSSLPPAAMGYGNFVGEYLPKNRYPGSPLIAADLLRDQDELRLHEIHSTDYLQLAALFKKDRRVRVFNADGFTAMKSQLPVQNARALILIDPSYELDADYFKVADAVKEGVQRMPNAVFVVWYPVVAARPLQPMLKKLARLGGERSLKIELRLEKGVSTKRMQASGVLVINGPWTLPDTMNDALQVIATQVGGKFSIAGE